MPLLKGRFLTPLEPDREFGSGETVFTIQHTGEKFNSKTEYEKKLRVYDAPLWTCQCTGHINLKHREAVESENKTRDHVKDKFPEIFEKTVLELVHHCSDNLDALVDKASLQLYEYMVPGESVTLKLKAANTISGIIVRADPQPPENGSSPSSDKENCDKTNTTTPKKASAEKQGSPKSPYKGLPKLAPCKYSFKLDGEDKIINGIPAGDIIRTLKIPSKDLLKLFIRCYATRGGYFFNSPWIVNAETCRKYNIKDIIKEDFVSPKKRLEHGQKAFDDTAAECVKSTKSRRSSSISSLTSPARYGSGKKQAFETNKSSSKTEGKKSPSKHSKQSKLNFGVKGDERKKSHASPKKGPSTPNKKNEQTVEISSDDDSDIEEISLAELKQRSPSKSPMKAAKPSKSKSPRKQSLKKSKAESQTEDSSSDDDDMPLSKLKSTLSPVKVNDKGKKGKDKGKDKAKKLKQATLFDMKASKKSKSTSGSKPSTPVKKSSKTPSQPPMVESDVPFLKPPSQPPLVDRLLKEVKKKDKGNKNVIIQLAFRCVKELSERQRKNLPSEVAELVQSKWEKHEEKKKLAKMSPEERKAYFKEKQRKRLKENKKNKSKTNKKCEDSELKLKPLPQPKLVPTPDGLPNELFGHVAMVTEFMNSYKGLLMPDDEFPIYTDVLMKSIAGGEKEFKYMSQVLSTMLQTLLQDELASDYRELKIPLTEIPVNQFTTSEMVRLCLRKHDTGEDTETESDESSDSIEEIDEISEELLEKLENTEVFELTADEKVQILIGLCDRLMGTYSVQDYMQEKMTESTELWRKKMKMSKDSKDKGKKKENSENTTNKDEQNKNGNVTLDKFYGPKDSGAENSEQEDLATVVKKRRLNAAKDKEERLKREREEKIKREAEYEHNRKLLEEEKLDKAFHEGTALAKMVLRSTPIGTDRNHNRYWLFTSSTPGLFVEKGWACQHMDYCVRPKNAPSESDDSSSSEDEADQEQDKKTRTKRERCHDKTFPHKGQNLWFVYETEKELANLLENLAQKGVREAALRQEIMKKESHIKDIFNKAEKLHKETAKLDPGEDVTNGFREELLETENKVRAGGLGGVVDYDSWENQLNEATTIPQFGECLKESLNNIAYKFLEGMLAEKETIAVAIEKPEPKEDDEDLQKPLTQVIQPGKLKWEEAVDNCSTWSRLHVLLGILDSCVKWEKSAENAKCKICKRKGMEEMLLLCDDCNHPFHMYCLRPRLDEIPQGDWFCPSCVPADQRRRSRVSTRRVFDNSEPSSGRRSARKAADNLIISESEEEELIHDTECIVCSGDEQLVFCATCPSAFHLDCHNPVLKREPRKSWRCQQCTTGIRIRKSRRAAAKKRKRYDDDFVEDWESDSEKPRKRKKTEEEIIRVDTSKSRKERYQNRYGEQLNEESEDDSETEEESVSDSEVSDTANNESQELEEYLVKDSTVSNRSSSKGRKRASYKYSDDDYDDETDCESTPAKKSKEEESPKSSAKKKKPRSKPRVNGDVDVHVIEMKHAQEILGKLRRHKHSWPFQDPVDKDMVPDYYEIVEKPMDFLTIKKKCEADQYKSITEFIEDIAQVFTNCELYNKPDSEVYKCIAPLEKIVRDSIQRLLPGVCYSRNGNPMADHDYL